MTKIVNYGIQPGQSYQGVGHVEGMSHEHIVVTADYVMSHNEELKCGELMFKCAFVRGEANYIMLNMSQDRNAGFESLMDEGLVSLGSVNTEAYRLIVFLNLHVHNVDTMTNTGSKVARRRIVVFFLDDPEVRIVSARGGQSVIGDEPRKGRGKLQAPQAGLERERNLAVRALE